jgi:hypothetical protein
MHDEAKASSVITERDPDAVVRLSGAHCALALVERGFSVIRREADKIVLRKPGRLVIVPDVLAVPASIVDSICADGDATYDAFLCALDDAPTQPELSLASLLEAGSRA